MTRCHGTGLALLLVAGCASSSTGEVLRLTPAPPANGCAAASQPDPLPTPEQFVGNAPILAAFDSAGVAGPGRLLVTVQFGPDGHVVSLRRLDATLPEAQVASALSLLRRRAKVMSSMANSDLRLLVERGDSVSLTFGRSEYCAPQLTSPVRRTFTTKVRVDQPGAAPQPVRIPLPEFRLLVDRQGHTARVELSRSSGNAELDQQIAGDLEHNTYRPATLDGEPRAAWITLPRR